MVYTVIEAVSLAQVNTDSWIVPLRSYDNIVTSGTLPDDLLKSTQDHKIAGHVL